MKIASFGQGEGTLEKLTQLLAAWRRKLSRHSTEHDPGELTIDEVKAGAWSKHEPPVGGH